MVSKIPSALGVKHMQPSTLEEISAVHSLATLTMIKKNMGGQSCWTSPRKLIQGYPASNTKQILLLDIRFFSIING